MNKKDIGILIVDDEPSVRNSLSKWFEEDGYRVGSANDAADAQRKLQEGRWDIVFLDIKLPGMDGVELQKRIKEIDPHIITIMITAYASVDTAVRSLKEGAFDYVTKPIDPDYLTHLVNNAVRQQQLTIENIQLREQITKLHKFDEIICESSQMEKVLELAKMVAPTDTTVMIRGESGVGKELVARLIHANSKRRYFPFVPVNCGGMAESLLESEFFGHEKGAFTGAEYQRKGKLEMADGGTLFLDEVGNVSMKTQMDLLRTLETKQFTRLGGNKVINVDFRVVCATNKNLEFAIEEGTFREDFYYRLNVFTIFIPPLRERPADIPPLAEHFVQKYAISMNKNITGISDEAMEMLKRHHWPGNVRELANAIERAVVIEPGPLLRKEDLPIQIVQKSESPQLESLEAVEKAHIQYILEKTDRNISQAARTLKIDRVTLYSKIKKYGLK